MHELCDGRKQDQLRR